MGRPTAGNQVTLSNTYSFTATYNRAGNLLTQTFPSGRKVSYSYDARGLTTVDGAWTSTGPSVISYARNIDYASHGAMFKMQYGNDLWSHTHFENNRLQATKIGLGTSQNGTPMFASGVASDWSHLQLTLGYGTSNNNGNLRSQAINGGIAVTQNYFYDGYNRLSSANESGGVWNQTYVYDTRGNRALLNGSALASGAGVTPLTPSTATVPYNAQNRWSSAGYDAAGNQTSLAGRTMQYDAEERLIVASDSGLAWTATYDAEGRRVSKVVNNGTTVTTSVYVYDLGGSLAAEYQSFSAASTYKPRGTSYLTTDHLGSTRVVTDPVGTVISRHDYLPFGEEIPSSWNGRSGVPAYGAGAGTADGVKVEFTGKERDAETGLDYFGARYFAGAQGRFTSADDPFSGAYRGNPQSWNRYSYALNNPLLYIDPDGHEPCENGRNPENGNLCTVTVAKAPPGTGETVRANIKSAVNLVIDLLNLTPAGLLYQNLAGRPGIERLQPSTINEANQMRANALSDGYMLIGELVIPEKAALLAAAAANDVGPLSRAGRALQKHGSRSGSRFPAPAGGPTQLNETGLRIVESILNDPGRVVQIRHHARFGEILEIKSSGGQGVRFTSDGKQLIGFIE